MDKKGQYMKDKSVRVSEAVYRRIERIAKNSKRTIKATIEIALDHMEKLIIGKRNEQ